MFTKQGETAKRVGDVEAVHIIRTIVGSRKSCHKCKSVGHIQKRCGAVAKWRAANLTKKATKSSVHSVQEQTVDYRQAYAINHVDVTPPSDE